MGGTDNREIYVLVNRLYEFLETTGMKDTDSLVSPIRCMEKWHP